MKVADLTPESIEKIKAYRWDNFIEKHEGPFQYGQSWEWHDFEFMEIEGYDVLLPVESTHHKNIMVEKIAMSRDDKTLTMFLKDTTYYPSPEQEIFAGIIAIAEKVRDENFYVTVLYHERYIVKNPT